MKIKNQVIGKILLFGVILIFSLNFVIAAASFQIDSFSCSPSESAINSVFSCTAQIKNNGDASGSVSTATLYPDSNNWLENSNYPQASGTSVSPGQTAEVTFIGLRSVKSGNNGFSKIMLDSVTDTYVADNNKKVNIINVVVTVSNSASSAAKGASFDSTAEVTAGGNIDVSLTLAVNSGGCSIGSQTNPKTITGMTDGNKQSSSWTITQGTSGDCKYTIFAAATGTGGVASKTDSTPSTITCTNCPSGGSNVISSGGGGGGAGGAEGKVYTIGELVSSQVVELSDNEKAKFSISGEEHTLTLLSHTETTATISIESEKQTFTLEVEQEKEMDLNKDNLNDLSVKLKSVNIITNKAKFILNPLTKPSEIGKKAPITGGVVSEGEGIGGLIKANKILYIFIAVFVVLAIASAIYYYFIRKKGKLLLGGYLR